VNPEFLSWPDIRNLIVRFTPRRQPLLALYNQLPTTRCRRRTRCCSLLPEMSLPEALNALNSIRRFPPDRSLSLLKQTVRYFLINPLEITSCPFLKGWDCLIYEDRFFGCRAYGLWSPKEYQRRAEANQRAKRNMGEQWLRLGIRLTAEVINFQVPYCQEVFPAEPGLVCDPALTEVEEGIEQISEQLHPWSGRFRDLYFSDLSFLVAGLIFGIPEAVRLKFILVKEGLQTGSRRRLDEVVRGLDLRRDFFT
jgi:hypothetical protein